MLRNLTVWGLCLFALVAIIGCDDDDDGNGGLSAYNAVLLRPDRLPSLSGGLVYEGWLVQVDDDGNWTEQKSFGKFFWDEFNYKFRASDGSGTQIDSVFEAEANIYDYDLVAITLEQYPNDPSGDPSPTIVAQSAIIPDRVTMMRFPVNFDGVPPGSFAVGTFSDGNWQELGEPDKALERFGVWFLDLTVGPTGNEGAEQFATALTLPVLPDTGYLYEGWVTTAIGDTISTGKFFFADYQDYSNRHCDLRAIPNYPGEDFLVDRPSWIPEARWPLDCMTGGQTLVTVEPNPDNDLLRPSNLIVLRGNMPARAADQNSDARRTNFPMGSVAGVTFPVIEAVFVKR